MQATYGHITAVALTFALAGLVKGVIGMGLPTIAMGLLGSLMPPAEAAGLIVVPSLITNGWQICSGRHQRTLICRTWPMLLMNFLATWAGAGLITGTSETATVLLGASLICYAALSLAKIGTCVSRRYEAWLSPMIGAATGAIAGATGVFVIPVVPYLQALRLEKDELVQALGLSFTVSSIALAIGLASHNALQIATITGSGLCTLPSLIGMGIGQLIRAGINEAQFRLLFLISLVLLGSNLLLVSIV